MNQIFEDFVDSTNWRPVSEYFGSIDSRIDLDVTKMVNQDSSRRDSLRELIEKEYEVSCVKDEKMKWAELELLSGDVVAADGTFVMVPLITGIKAQIGVICVAYNGLKTEYAGYFYEPFVQIETKDIRDWLARVRKLDDEDAAFSSAHIRTIMLYMERLKVLERKEKWKIVHGPMMPHELRTGQGRLKALNKCLALGLKMINSKKTISVIGNTTDPMLNILGTALKPNEYVKVWSLTDDLSNFLESANFNPTDKERFKVFIDQTRDLIYVGIFKVRNKAYVFQAHKDYFDEAAAIILRDANFQPIRGFPLLVDYADAICTHLMPSGDFKKQVEFKLAKKMALEAQIPEHDTRRR